MLPSLNKLLAKYLLKVIRFYQLFISPFLLARCRFYPTCSQYALEAVRLHGGLLGGYLAVKRICRCHPFGGSGVDFVPLPLYRLKYQLLEKLPMGFYVFVYKIR